MASLAIGLVGLRRADAWQRWLAAGVTVHGCDADPAHAAAAARAGVHVWPSAVAVAQAVPAPRVVWVDVAPGRTTEVALQDVWPELARGEVIVDGGAGDWRDARRREASLAAAGVRFADAALRADGMHVGGNAAAIAAMHPMLDALGAWRHCGAAGAAHFLRMVDAGVALATEAARAEAGALVAAHPELVAAAAGYPGAAASAPAAEHAHGVIHAALARGVPAPVLSLALALAPGGARQQPKEEGPAS
ncbi:MAG: NAD(P)-binding domain-containing protein [Burkholderiales bacterium]